VATAAAPKPEARSSSVENFRSELQWTQGIGVRPAAYSLTKFRVTVASNSRSKFTR
jgi:hypothetical protein